MEREIPIRPSTRRLVNNLQLDLPMDPPLITDFGIQTADHYRALRDVLLRQAGDDEPKTVDESTAITDARIMYLDDAYGHGPRLNALVKLYAPDYADHIKFETSWDILAGRTGDEAERLQQEAEKQYQDNMAEPYEIPDNIKPLLAFLHDPDAPGWLTEVREELLGKHWEAVAKQGGTLEVHPIRTNKWPTHPTQEICPPEEATSWAVYLDTKAGLDQIQQVALKDEALEFAEKFQKAFPHLDSADRHPADRHDTQPEEKSAAQTQAETKQPTRNALTELLGRDSQQYRDPKQKRERGDDMER